MKMSDLGRPMPWVYKARRGIRSRLKQWAFDHSSEFTEIKIGIWIVVSIIVLILIMNRLI